MTRDLIKQLSRKRGLADSRRADEQIKSRSNSIESSAQVRKAGFPAGYFAGVVFPREFTQDIVEKRALGLRQGSFRHRVGSLTSLHRCGKAHRPLTQCVIPYYGLGV